MERKSSNTQRSDVPGELQPLLEVNPNVLVYADIPRHLYQGLLSQSEIAAIASKHKPQFPEVKKAFFYLDGEGQQWLKIFAYANDYAEEIRLEGDMRENLQGSMFQEVVWYCLKVGFQVGTFPVDNRTELQYVEDYDEYARVTVELKKRPLSYGKWRETQTLSF